MTTTGATFSPVNGFLQITPAQFSNLKSLFFEIGGVSVLSTSLPFGRAHASRRLFDRKHSSLRQMLSCGRVQ